MISLSLFSDTTAITMYFSVSIKLFMFALVILGKNPNLSALIHLSNVLFKVSLSSRTVVLAVKKINTL